MTLSQCLDILNLMSRMPYPLFPKTVYRSVKRKMENPYHTASFEIGSVDDNNETVPPCTSKYLHKDEMRVSLSGDWISSDKDNLHLIHVSE